MSLYCLQINYLAYHKEKFSAIACQMMWTVAQADQICGVHLQSHLEDNSKVEGNIEYIKLSLT